MNAQKVRSRLQLAVANALGRADGAFWTRMSDGPRGCEAIIRDAVAEALGEETSTEVRRSLGGHRSSRGHIDIVTGSAGQEVAIELKVCEFPRTKNNGNGQALYDVGQILSDAIGIAESGYRSGYCIALLYTRGVFPPWSDGGVRKAFHNAMFCDLEQSKRFGELSVQSKDVERRKQLEMARKFGWHEPFGGSSSVEDFVVRHESRLAAVGIYVGGVA